MPAGLFLIGLSQYFLPFTNTVFLLVTDIAQTVELQKTRLAHWLDLLAARMRSVDGSTQMVRAPPPPLRPIARLRRLVPVRSAFPAHPLQGFPGRHQTGPCAAQSRSGIDSLLGSSYDPSHVSQLRRASDELQRFCSSRLALPSIDIVLVSNRDGTGLPKLFEGLVHVAEVCVLVPPPSCCSAASSFA